LLDYGLEGYGLYWYCIELIAGKVDKENITFELEHDARIIARNVGSTPQKVEEMMRYFVDIGLFENSQGVITCLKLARRLDKSMTSNPQMREIIDKFKSHDGVMTPSEKPMQDKTRLDQIKEPLVEAEPQRTKKHKFSDEDMRFAEEMLKRIKIINPATKQPSMESWANTIRLMREIDGRTHKEMWAAFDWANRDSFWCTNILSPTKLRKQYEKLVVRMSNMGQPSQKPKQETVQYAQPDIEKAMQELNDL